jgi:hypothetical protein
MINTILERSEFLYALTIAISECKDNNALTYLLALKRSFAEYGTHGIAVQLQYALSNIQYWRGDNAKKVKAYFKKIIKELESK